MKKLRVDVEDIAMIMDNQDRLGSSYYLDTETGETVIIPDEVITALEEGESCEGLPSWEVELLPQAKEIFEGSERYEEIPIRDSHEAFQHMADFTQRVKDSRLKGKLELALGGRGSFHRFRDALKEYPELEKEWFKFKADRDKEAVKEWLESIGIEMEG
ncbi:MAG: UPF0158 family protein [Deltaproteobacteria bacterium]